MLRLSSKLRSTDTADGAVLLDIRHGRMFTFNPTGSRILQMLRSGVDEKEIALMLVREFSADPATAAGDASEFLTLLREQGFLEV